MSEADVSRTFVVVPFERVGLKIGPRQALVVDAPAIKNWLQLDEAHSEYVGLARHNNAYSDAEEFVLQYRVTGKRKGKDVELPAYIVVVRRAIGPGKFDFRVENVIDFDPMTLDLN